MLALQIVKIILSGMNLLSEGIFADQAPVYRKGLGMKLNTNLKNLIARHGIKITHLSKATGVPVQTLHNWLASQPPRNIDQVKKVAEHFGVSLDLLLYGDKLTNKSVLDEFVDDELYAGQYEVVLRRIVR